MDANTSRAARHARRASLLPVAQFNPALLYWGIVYADSSLSLMRGMRGEHLVKVTAAAKPWAKVAKDN